MGSFLSPPWSRMIQIILTQSGLDAFFSKVQRTEPKLVITRLRRNREPAILILVAEIADTLCKVWTGNPARLKAAVYVSTVYCEHSGLDGLSKYQARSKWLTLSQVSLNVTNF